MSDRLIPFTQWLDRLRVQGLPLNTPAPPAYQTYSEWYANSRGVNPLTGERALKSYGDWIFERQKLNLPQGTAPPAGYERYEDWFRRIRGMDPITGRAISPLTDPLIVGQPRSGQTCVETTSHQRAAPGTATATSSFLRRAVLTAGTIASRLGGIGRGVSNALPAMGAMSTIIHAVRETRDAHSGRPLGGASQRPGPHALRV